MHDEARDVAASTVARDLEAGGAAVVPGDDDDGAPPSPLSMEWIERELLEGRARGGTMEMENDDDDDYDDGRRERSTTLKSR